MTIICIYPLSQFFHQHTQKYIHLLFQFLRTRNDKGKKYKILFQTFVGRQIVRHDKNWPTRIHTACLIMRLETIWRQAKADTPGVPCKLWIKVVQDLPSFTINKMQHNIRSSLSCVPSLCHLICFAVSSDKYNHLSLKVIDM
jgi:hypothetical protein